MAKKLTFFELHFDGAKFGGLRNLAKREDTDTSEIMLSDLQDADEELLDVEDVEVEIADADVEAESEDDSGRGVGRFLGLLAGVAVLGIAVRSLRRRRSGDADPIVFDEDEGVEGDDLEIEN